VGVGVEAGVLVQPSHPTIRLHHQLRISGEVMSQPAAGGVAMGGSGMAMGEEAWRIAASQARRGRFLQKGWIAMNSCDRNQEFVYKF
jgi:hypothetical protein